MRLMARVAVAATMLVLAGAGPAAADDEEGRFENQISDDNISVSYSNLTIADAPGTSGTSSASLQQAADKLGPTPFPCIVKAVVEDPETGEEIGALVPLDDEECAAADGPTAVEIAAAVSSAFRTLHLSPSPITYQPDGTWALINVDFIVYTDPAVQTLDSEVFGIPITIRATPVHYLWDFDDGSTISTTDPGRPYPDQTVAHVYTTAADAVAVSLTTSFQGEFTYAGADGWLPIAGLATTTSTAEPVEIVAMDVNLVPND